jgi:hypothetical protein
MITEHTRLPALYLAMIPCIELLMQKTWFHIYLPCHKFPAMAKFWLKEPQQHDFPAAADYLELLFDEKEVK